MGFWNFGDLRTLLATETDHDSPGSEELVSQIRENIEAIIMLMLDTGVSGTATSDPSNNTNGYFFDTAGGWSDDQHNGRTLLITSGNAIGNTYTIDDTIDAGDYLACAGDNLYADGVRSGDSYKILYDIKVNTDGHNHDGINSSIPALGDASIIKDKLKTGTGSASGAISASSGADIQGQDYSFAPNIYTADRSLRMTGHSVLTANYVMRFGFYNTDGANPWNYAVYYRYITSSDHPFVFVLKDKATGEIAHVWAADDPPPGYWGEKETPEGFVPPIFLGGNQEKYDAVACWDVEKKVFNDIIGVIQNTGPGAHKQVGKIYRFENGKVLKKKESDDE